MNICGFTVAPLLMFAFQQTKFVLVGDQSSMFVFSFGFVFFSLDSIQMSNLFFYVDGQGRVIDEQGAETMDLEEEVDP